MPNETDLSPEDEQAILDMIENNEERSSQKEEKPAKRSKKSPPKSNSKKNTKTKEPEFSMWNWLEKVVGYNIGEFFGDTVCAKTKTCQQIAVECAEEGKQVKFIDHEANLDQEDVAYMKSKGIHYKLMPRKEDLYDLKKDDLKGIDLLIIDSATLAITGSWKKLNMQGKGSLLQAYHGLLYRLSQACIESKKHIVLITAQPISVMGDRNLIQPVGDKADFFVKEIYYIKADRGADGFITSRKMLAYRSRKFPDGTLITSIKTLKFGAELDKQQMMKILN